MLTKMPDKEYFAAEGVSASTLKAFARSKMAVGVDIVPSEAMQFGTCVHALAMEHKEVFEIAPNVDRRTKAGKEAWLHFESACDENSLIPMKQDMADGIYKAVESLKAHPIASIITKDESCAEVAAFSECPYTGLKIKAKFDYLPETGSILFDLKTSRDASPEAFKRSIRYDYWIQAVHYLNIARECGLDRIQQFMFVAVDNKEPYGVGCYLFDENAFDMYIGRYIALIEEFANWKAEGSFNSAHTETYETFV